MNERSAKSGGVVEMADQQRKERRARQVAEEVSEMNISADLLRLEGSECGAFARLQAVLAMAAELKRRLESGEPLLDTPMANGKTLGACTFAEVREMGEACADLAQRLPK